MSIKIVISGGCSFTFGSELADDIGPEIAATIDRMSAQTGERFTAGPIGHHFGPSEFSWANLVAKKLKAKHINTAIGGRSNSFISRRVINSVCEALQQDYKPEEIFVQVMWTFAARIELAVTFDTRRADSPWLPVDPYAMDDESKSNWFSRLDPKTTLHWQEVHDDMHEQYELNKGLGVVDFAKAYYAITDALNDTYQSLKDILMLQELLENKNIKYIFTHASEHAMDGLIGPSNRYIDSIRSFIKFDEWYNFPGAETSMGFHQWAKANGYPYATSHPLEKGHEDAAELLYQKIKTMI